MTEIPEHLLKRSKSAKAARSGGGDAGDAAPAPAEGSSAPAAQAPATPAAAAERAPLVPTAELPNLDPEPPPARPEPVYVTAGRSRKKIPVWALPVVAALPVWALSYAGTMQQPEVEDPLYIEGELFYGEAGCAGCHGPTGGGGTGYQLSGGSVLETFPEPIDHMVHVARGSVAIEGEEYGGERGDGRRVAGQRGQMPAQQGLISRVELEMIVFHERAVLSEEDISSPEYEEWMEHMRESFESGEELPVDEEYLEFLLRCANPDITPGATGEGSEDPEKEPCPGPPAPEGEEGEAEEAALGG